MKVSIITVCYNRADTIGDTFESVLSQTHSDFEYIVVDGASQDNTVEIIKQYEPLLQGRMRWVSEPDKGLYDAMNKGLRMATGEFIALINSDDLICDSHALEKVANIFQLDKTLDAVYANIFYVSQKDTSKIVRTWNVGTQKLFRTGWHPAHPALYIKKDVYDKYGLFNLDYELAADFELMLRFIDRYKIKIDYIPEFFVKMRLGGETNKSLKNICKGNIECIKAFKDNQVPVNPILYPFCRILPKLLQFVK
jgi:glycosyltransferase involved in cell wall biosynthesis